MPGIWGNRPVFKQFVALESDLGSGLQSGMDSSLVSAPKSVPDCVQYWPFRARRRVVLASEDRFVRLAGQKKAPQRASAR